MRTFANICELLRVFASIAVAVALTVVAAHLAPFVACSRERVHHAARILLGHVEERHRVAQVDVSHVYAPCDVLVEELHHLAGIEAVFLAEVDEQAVVAGLCLSAAAVALLSCAVALAVAASAAPGVGFHDFGSVGIVGEELSELHRHDLLDDVFLVDILEEAVDVLHEGSDLVLQDVGLHNLVHHLVELFFADFIGRWDVALLKVLAYFLLYLAYLVLLLRVDDADAGALLPGAPRAPRAVGVVLDVVGQSVVDDVRQVVDVEASGSHVGSHEELRQVLAELLHREVALLLREVAV